MSDAAFTGKRILEGMALGASVEVDLVVHADGGYAVLHDLSVERETTGQGKVAELSATQLRSFRLRGIDGSPVDEPVMLLEDLCALLAQGPRHPDAVLQLDYKQDWTVLDARALASFQASVAPVARHMMLSSGDAESVRLLTSGVAGLRVGYDPCHDGAIERLMQTHDFEGFVREAVAASPQAEMIYLYHGLVLEADRLGFDIIAAFQDAGRRVDAYTINRANETSRPIVERLLALRADQITTDDPEGLLALMERAV